jgi:hypothetical protein
LVLLQKAKIPNIFDLISWLSNWLTPYVSDKNLVIEQIGQTFSQSNRFLAIWHTLNGEVALDIGNYSTAIKS